MASITEKTVGFTGTLLAARTYGGLDPVRVEAVAALDEVLGLVDRGEGGLEVRITAVTGPREHGQA